MKMMAIYATLLTSVCQTVQSAPTETETNLQKLVERLGSNSFRDRELAARELIRLGADSKNALEKGCQSNDAEVANRCKKLLPLAYEFYVTRLLDAYLAKPDGKLPEDLPGAKRWLEVAGRSKESTELYIELIKTHRTILLEIAENPDSVSEVYRKFTLELFPRLRPNVETLRSNDYALSRVDLALFLFLATDPKLNRNLTEVANNRLGSSYYFMNQTGWTKLLSQKEGIPAFRNLFTEFLGSETNAKSLGRALTIAVECELKEALPTLLKLAKNKNTLGTVRASAILAFSKLGTKDTIRDLLPFLEDNTVVANVRINDDWKQVEMRDVALGVALMLCNQTMTEFGFERNPPNTSGSSISISYIYFSFASPEDREVAMKHWKHYATKEKILK